ncbi:UbiA family prenyltransferase [Profundibacterium mesophilum]|uniref:4-hydroxybenzoate polyprenyltransferase n=1 Tax=Profundibacterium mesophilum KAUST100406-0324 TaxID=1037889 RepID=A0A921TEV2_9RHOB|nr:UbiA family prenyltransferase [Profundibacterium mesophilum]KAF0675809.1 4-hydroxybenzoate polyprenyltransferase [Profundibacterium mesophilum KAUST100406-0324]
MAEPPLVVALPALMRTGLQLETLWAALGREPLALLDAVRRRDGAALMAAAGLRHDLLPLAAATEARIDEALARGRRVLLMSERPDLAAPLAETLGLELLAMPRMERRAALDAHFGAGGYELLAAPRAFAELPRRAMLRALRPHQWVKNVLLFLAPIAAHAFDLPTLIQILLGIVAFSAAASSIYIINDLLDLEADRLHETKRRRPFAAGALPLWSGMAGFALLVALALGLGAVLGGEFVAVLMIYVGLSLGYSLRLKRMRWIDVFTLAALYTLRVFAGAAAGGVEASIYMLIFIFPVFLTLGCVKRLTELARAKDQGRLPGRGYGKADQEDLLNMAGLGTVGALVIFALYITTEHAAALYPTRWMLWLALPPIALWLIRMIALGARGRMDYDPIVFALRDRRGIGLLLITLSLMFYSAGLWAEWFG